MPGFDTIVVGLGAMGSACAYQLVKRGQRVLGIDRYRPPHAMGSSHGDTRITRQAIGEGEAYVPLVTRSHEIWREIEPETGTSLLTQCGALIMAERDSVANHHGKADFVRRTIAAAQRFGIPHEVLDAAEIGRRYPQFGLTGGEIGYFEPGGGFVRPERCITAQLDLASVRGAELLLDAAVVAIAPDGSGAPAVTTADGSRFTAARVVVAAGAMGGRPGRERYGQASADMPPGPALVRRGRRRSLRGGAVPRVHLNARGGAGGLFLRVPDLGWPLGRQGGHRAIRTQRSRTCWTGQLRQRSRRRCSGSMSKAALVDCVPKPCGRRCACIP